MRHIFLPSAFGGGGTCIQCTCQVHDGVEVFCLLKNHIFLKEIAENYRLGCQVK